MFASCDKKANCYLTTIHNLATEQNMFLSLNYRRENRFKKNGGPSYDGTALYIVDIYISAHGLCIF